MFSYIFADSYRPPIYASDWLIFCCGNLILHKKKINENDKNKFYDEKQQQKCQKSI